MSAKPLTDERLAEIRSLLRYESSISFHSARAKESMLLLLAEVHRLRAELAHAVPHARELALKDAARWMCEESPEAAFDRIHEAAQDAQRDANAALDKAVAR
ncbi:hypothetical protein ABZ876_08090 [Streptomyces sp. NPDC046931]|uniref:hypothetical protein n=1 Tax=Streptomyces sp. NPDC046931 TaxID=3154806 RepID=UPI0033EB9FF2